MHNHSEAFKEPQDNILCVETTIKECSKKKTQFLCRFDCLVHINVIPSLDVSAVQIEMYTNLRKPYYEPSGKLKVLTDPESIHTTPVGKKHLQPCRCVSTKHEISFT